MIWRIRIGRWRFTFSMAPLTETYGVNSTLPDGNHILMWDFDDVPLTDVIWELERVQHTYELPNIYILNTGKDNHHIAYCFKRTPWRKAIEIMAFTQHIDWSAFRWSIYRGKFTLRVGPKNYRRPRLVHTLRSNVQEDVFLPELRSWVKYETLEDGYPTKVREVKVR